MAAEEDESAQVPSAPQEDASPQAEVIAGSDRAEARVVARRAGMAEDKRAYDRVRSLNLVSLSKFSEGGYVELAELGRTLDLSEGGIKLEAFEVIPVGTRTRLRIGLREEIIDVEGRVAYLQEGDEGRIVTGIEFLDLTDEHMQVLQRFLSDKSE